MTMHPEDILTIDLHVHSDMLVVEQEIDRILFRATKERKRSVRIVHGIGSGILSQRIHELLSVHPLVRTYEREDHGGSTIVHL